MTSGQKLSDGLQDGSGEGVWLPYWAEGAETPRAEAMRS